jgi:hypothetical protein
MDKYKRLPGVGSALVFAATMAVVLFVAYQVSASVSSVIVPISDGNYTQWTPSVGTSHFANVDDSSCNGTTDYNSTTAVGNRDSYGVSLSSIPNGATITQIDIKPCASRVNSGGTNPIMNVFYRENGSDSADSGSYSLTGTTPTDLATTSFSGLSTVKSSATTLEIGAVLTSGTKGARLSRIATQITFTPLNAPTNLSGTATTSSQIKLTWSDNSSNEDGFYVEQSSDALNWTQIATTSANVSTYYATGLSPLTTYYHRVRAFNAGATTDYTNTATTTTQDVPPAAPSNLTLMTQSDGTSTDIVLNWNDNSSNETGFKIERALGTSTVFSQIASTTANVITYTDALLGSGTYTYQVRAFNGGGNSGYSNQASTTIP